MDNTLTESNKEDAILYPLRFMSGNPNTSKIDVNDMIKYIRTMSLSRKY